MKHLCPRLLLLILCVTTLAIAQSTDATISGLVVDPSGRIIPDAEIVILNETTGIHYTNKTNGTGIYTVSILPPGQYRLQVSKIGFKTLIKPGIVLNVQSAVALNFTLPIGAASESITVEAGTSLLNTTDASVGTVVDRKLVSNIPLNGRSFQDLISLTPGVVTQSPQSGSTLGDNGDFSVNGQRTESNNYTIDGVTGNIASGDGYGGAGAATGGALGGATALGTTQSLISVDALQEFRVQTSTYSAEYGRSPGGQFSLVTRSGTKIFHGTLFDYLRNDFFDANDWFNDHYGKPISALRQNDFGGTFGGPMWIPGIYNGKNNTFFFVSYEGLRLTQPTAAAIQYVPDLFMRQQAAAAIQPILNAYPLPNGLDYGNSVSPNLAQFIAPFSLPSSIDSTSVRIDHTFGDHLSAFFRYGYTPSSTTSRPDFARLESSTNIQTYTLGLSSQFSTRFNNDWRLGYDRTASSNVGVVDNFGGATPVNLAAAMGAGSLSGSYPAIYLSIPGIGTSLFTAPNSTNFGRQWNLVDTFTMSAGRHELKFGVDYRHIISPLRPADPQILVEYLSPQSLLNNLADYPDVSRFIAATPVFNETALFAQDQWRVAPSVQLSLGIRWEVNPPPTEAHGHDAYTLRGSIGNPASLTVAPQGTPLWKTTWYNFAPRLGVAWTAHRQSGRETVVRSGGGVFFDNLNQIGALGYLGLGFRASQIYSGSSLPFTSAQLLFPVTTTAPYTSAVIYAFPSHLQQPYTLQWNTSVQQALGKMQTFTISYVGANGRRLVNMQELYLNSLNSNFNGVLYFPGGVTSSYQALQGQFQRSVSHGLQVLASYTWSHSLDFGSTSATLPLMRGNSDYDVRNSLQAGLSWDLPKVSTNRLADALLNGWGLDGRVIARSAFPIPLTGSAYVDPATGNETYSGLSFVANQPLYLHSSQYPGGRIINPQAFTIPPTGIQGDAPRNFVRGFGATQINFAARREFHLHDALALQFRAEAFNLLNHPNFGYVDPTYTDATFGQATQMLNRSLGTVASQYQQGGARSMQFALKLLF
ncbi:hypothetical protein HNQ77_000942 [Silvibacterium bohemicum]|uniref:TonB-dependent transporter Oar-like beta-barrel domain-containing protein n=1 Tax=Silvibacterium bohemicum TaxID=1577686 RepID=A0A841JX33_9BACT|nr:TonB-dependent receptor [Silvibacterium bohemicum]MBB6142998.1 hypothetical protein [Silvibacterium bohemicum]